MTFQSSPHSMSYGCLVTDGARTVPEPIVYAVVTWQVRRLCKGEMGAEALYLYWVRCCLCSLVAYFALALGPAESLGFNRPLAKVILGGSSPN